MAQKKRKSKAPKLPAEFLKKVKSITAKRPKTVIDHILKYGHVTTEELSSIYGYDHAPRAARDVRELGIPLDTFRVENKSGRKIAAYRFGDPSKIRGGTIGGRKAWSKEFKNALVALHGARCVVCFTPYEERYLQIDHRVPYEVGGDADIVQNTDDFMLVCGSCNRAKSWSCEHCRNWTTDHSVDICQTCYWASPDEHRHMALRLIRRLDLTWTESEIPDYDRLVQLSQHAEQYLPEFVKACLQRIADD